jgi:hypothetical protein
MIDEVGTPIKVGDRIAHANVRSSSIYFRAGTVVEVGEGFLRWKADKPMWSYQKGENEKITMIRKNFVRINED